MKVQYLLHFMEVPFIANHLGNIEIEMDKKDEGLYLRISTFQK